MKCYIMWLQKKNNNSVFLEIKRKNCTWQGQYNGGNIQITECLLGKVRDFASVQIF